MYAIMWKEWYIHVGPDTYESVHDKSTIIAFVKTAFLDQPTHSRGLITVYLVKSETKATYFSERLRPYSADLCLHCLQICFLLCVVFALGNYWTAGNDKLVEGQYMWGYPNGTNIVHDNWVDGEPNDSKSS